jgi:DNA-binding MarR family transcriptional regulator
MAKSTPTTDEADAIDAKVEGWIAELLPQLDPTVESIVQRIELIAKRVRKLLVETLAEHGLKWEEWSVLMILRKEGEPYRLSAGELAQHADISSGAMTNRLDRLEASGLVRRVPDPSDRRGVLVELTQEGIDAWTRAIDTQGNKEGVIATALDEQEREELNRLLRRLTRAFGGANPC